MIKNSITAIEQAGWSTPLVLRGPFTACIAQAGRLGYDGIEMHIVDSTELNKTEILRALKDHHIALTSIGTGPSYSQLGIFFTNSKPEIRAEALRRMTGHIQFGAETGAVVIIGLMKGQKKDCREPERYMEYFQAGMEHCIREAERLGVTVAFEVIDRFESDWLNTIDEGLTLLDGFGSDHLKLHLDTFHMNIEEADLAECIRRAGKQIGHVHVADSDRWYPGHAHYDFESTYQALKDAKYDGAIALESFLYPKPETAAALALERMNELRRKYFGQ